MEGGRLYYFTHLWLKRCTPYSDWFETNCDVFMDHRVFTGPRDSFAVGIRKKIFSVFTGTLLQLRCFNASITSNSIVSNIFYLLLTLTSALTHFALYKLISSEDFEHHLLPGLLCRFVDLVSNIVYVSTAHTDTKNAIFQNETSS